MLVPLLAGGVGHVLLRDLGEAPILLAPSAQSLSKFAAIARSDPAVALGVGTLLRLLLEAGKSIVRAMTAKVSASARISA